MKRVLSLFLVCLIVLSLVPAAFADNSNNLTITGNNNNVVIVQDVANNHWAASAIETFVQTGVVNGTSSKTDTATGNELITFEPVKTFTRQEFAKVLALACGIEPEEDYTKQTFSDVPPGSWAYPYVEAVSPYMTGYGAAGSGTMNFMPAAPATRQEVMVAAAKVLNLPELTSSETNQVLAQFNDIGQISYALRPLIAATVKYNIILGDGNGNLNPQGSLSRAEGVVIMKRVTEVPTLQIKNVGVKSADTDNIDSIGQKISATSFTLYGEVPVETRVWIGIDGDEKRWEASVDYSGKFSYTFKNQYTADISELTFLISAEKNNASAKTSYTVEFAPPDNLSPTVTFIYPKTKDSYSATIDAVVSDPIFGSSASSAGPFKVYVNDELYSTEYRTSFTIYANLEYGENVFNVMVINPNGLSYTEELTIERPAGEVSVASTTASTTTESSIAISGTVSGTSSVSIYNMTTGDSRTAYATNGRFSYTFYSLQYGKNSFEITATNDAGISESIIVTVTRVVPSVTITTDTVPQSTNSYSIYMSATAANAKSVTVEFGGISTQSTYTRSSLYSDGSFYFYWYFNDGDGDYTATITAYAQDGTVGDVKTLSITRGLPPSPSPSPTPSTSPSQSDVTMTFVSVQSPAKARTLDGMELEVTASSYTAGNDSVTADYRFAKHGSSNGYLNGNYFYAYTYYDTTLTFSNLQFGENLFYVDLTDYSNKTVSFTVKVYLLYPQ